MPEINDHELAFRVALTRCAPLPSPLIFDILELSGGARELWTAPIGQLTEWGVPTRLADAIDAARRRINPEKEWCELSRLGIIAIAAEDERYPSRLRQITDPPLLLFVRGDITALRDDDSMAVIGTRRITPYGELATRQIVGEIATAGLTIVSGLALGVDAAAHEATLRVGGRTVAVLGSGIEPGGLTPRTNSQLGERLITAGGAAVSEYPPGTTAFKEHFPARNRIIAGLCRGVIVIEAATKSGSLITAARATDYNRDVFAVPGPITSATSEGPNDLLSRGAIACCRGTDVLRHYGHEPIVKPRVEIVFRPPQDVIVKRLRRGPTDLDGLAAGTGLTTAILLTELTSLELAGHVMRQGASYSFIK